VDDRDESSWEIEGDQTIAFSERAAGERRPAPADPLPAGGEASLILIYEPNHRSLGRRYSLRRGASLRIGRSEECEVSFPDVGGLSRIHGRLDFGDQGVFFEDLGSTNGSSVNERRVDGRVALASGDHLQLAPLHFKFLHERDIENAYFQTLHDLATRDGLTELDNKRRFDDELAREFARARRHLRPLALILFDVDRFKSINDRYGHLGGDFVLQRLARIAGRFIRPEQVLARIGGEEFAVLCPETAEDGALTLAEKLRVTIAGSPFSPPPGEASLTVTCSFGAAALDDSMTEPSGLFAAADRALYRAKQGGRNHVCGAGS
jgi:diguanylate cyclase (GGDEF)-like protein